MQPQDIPSRPLWFDNNTGDSMNSGVYDILRDPVDGSVLQPQLTVRKSAIFGATGVLKGISRDYPVLGGVVVTLPALATESVIDHARKGHLDRALLEALTIEKRSTFASLNLLARLRYPRLVQSGGSPCGVLKGHYGTYFRYRYAVTNLPSTIGVLSCLNRHAAKNGYLLDVGSGFGHFYRYYRRSYQAERIVLMDNTLEFLLTASRFTDPKTLLVCADADSHLPFRREIFTDITVLNAFQVFTHKERFVKDAQTALDPQVGTLWLTNNWNPKCTHDFNGEAHPPSHWKTFCVSERWRLFPERHFADPVMRGGLINLTVNYVPQDDHPLWRSATLAYANAPWDKNGKCIPLNRPADWGHLVPNSVYFRHPFVHRRLIKRKVAIRYWDSHKDYYGFDLPDEVILPSRMDQRSGHGFQPLAESFVLVEAPCPAASSQARCFLSSLCAWLKEWLSDLNTRHQWAARLRSWMPLWVKTSARKLMSGSIITDSRR